MKKTFIFLGSILIIVFVVLSYLDTSDYALEKQLWKVQKKYDQISQDPKVVPDQNYDSLVQEYRAIIKKYPKSKLIPRVYVKIGKVYSLKKDYPNARKTFQEIINLFPDNAYLGSEALMYIAYTYDKEKNKIEVVNSYRKLITNYPHTKLGLNAPLYISTYYKRNNMIDEYNTALEDAIVYYKKLGRANAKTKIEFNSLRILASTYLAKNELKNAVNTLGELLLKFNSPEYMNPKRADLIIKSINRISVIQLKDYDLPLVIYQEFIKNNPEHGLSTYLKKMIDSLQELKDKGIYLSPTEK